ncbi:hypothetical protein TorRG33x02_021610 [Trema orientale]|uniref:Uncharacterized protein n=1 Tax=Trema orientale TaxID=63057 RepID=A0A2P5FX85_TREOI|nr:hypothetical protein TorRG33x02_021610 [Trema orientale]
MATSKRKAIAPSRETTKAAAAWSQNLPNTLHTFFHFTCEFPWYPIRPMATAAPLLEKSSPAMTKSPMTTKRLRPLLFPPRFPSERIREIAAYEHAMACATTKYLATEIHQTH